MEEAWENVLTVLTKQIGKNLAASWLKPLQPVSFEDATLTFRATTKFVADWVQSRYLSQLRKGWRAVGYEVENIAFATRREKSAA